MIRLTQFFLVSGLCVGMLAGCSSNNEERNSAADHMAAGSVNTAVQNADFGTSEETEVVVEEPYVPPESTPSLGLGDSFEDFAVAEGRLLYTIDKCEVFHDVRECSLKKTDFAETAEEEYDLIGEDGVIDPQYALVMLDVSAKNIDALGITKKTEFNIFSIKLTDIENGEVYPAIYFSEAEKSPVTGQPFYYNLEQNAEMHAKLGYLVPSSEVDTGQLKIEYRERLIELGLGKE